MEAKGFCWEYFSCGKEQCPAYRAEESACWLISGTLCREECQGDFLDKIEACLECPFFSETMDPSRLDATLRKFKGQMIEYRRMVDERDRELEATNLEMALGLSEVFVALRGIAAGNPEVRISEASDLELITKLKRMVNLTAVNIGEMVDLSHEFAMGLAEHFDVLHRVSSGDLTARVNGSSSLELLDSLKSVTNLTISSIAKEMEHRKRVEAALVESETKYRMIVNQIPGVVFRGYPDWSVDFFDDKIEFLTGYPREDFDSRRRKWCDIVNKEDLESLKDAFVTALRSDQSYFWEYRIITSWQGTIWVQNRAQIVCDDEGRIQYVSGILYDITERKQAEQALRLNQARLETMVKLGHMHRASLQEISDYALEKGVRLTRSEIGYLAFLKEDESLRTIACWSSDSMRECAIPDGTLVCPKTENGLVGDVVRERQPIIENDFANAGIRKEGNPLGLVEVRRRMNLPVLDGERIVAVAGVANKEEPYDETDVQQLTLLMDGMWKIVQRRQADQALETEKERLAVTLRSIGDGVVATDLNGNIRLMNHVAERLTGWSAADAVGRRVAEVFHFFDEASMSTVLDPVADVIRSGRAMELTTNTCLVARDKTQRFISASIAPIIDPKQNIIGVVLVVRDVTEARRIEAELARMDKLVSLGALAGGIAHDFNNILTAILGNISLSLLRAESDADLHQRLTDAQKACVRAQQLSIQLLTFAKGGAPIKKVAALQPLIEESSKLALCGSKSTCRLSLLPDLWPVEIDEGQFSQVIHNLIINADQAMHSGGLIEVVAENLAINDDRVVPLPPGQYIKVRIADKGIGIHPDHLPNVFTPYFTTKSRGNGLGLATAYSIIRNHEGLITVESEMGKGTTFSIFLPAAKAKACCAPAADDQPISGRGRILIMDDEEMVRQVLDAMLERLGYESTGARDGLEAIECYQQAQSEGHPFSAVIFDLTIAGGMGGKEAMEQLLTIDPEVKAIVSSGYSDDLILSDFQRFGFSGVLIKPYTINGLSQILDQVLLRSQAA